MGTIRAEIRRVTRHGSPPFNCLVTVESVTRLTEGFVRVAVAGEGLAAYGDVLPADAFKIMLAPQGHDTVDFPARDDDGLPFWPQGTRQPVLRAFTVRHFDAARQRIEFDVHRHRGATGRWLNRARPGEKIGLGGMRREFYPGEGVARHLIVGDASALPAIAAIGDSLPATASARVYLAVDHESDKDLLPRHENISVQWIPGGSPTGARSALEQAVRERERPGGRIQAWLAAEAGVVRELRRWVVDRLGVSRADLHAAAYWRAGLDSTAVDTLHLGRYDHEIAAGADATDPDVRERVEFDR